MKSVFVWIGLIFLLFELAPAQTFQSAPPDMFPSALTETECEGSPCAPGSGSAATWVFHGLSGDALWGNGAVAKLAVVRFDADGIVIQRIDLPTSSTYGSTAIYTGTLHGDHIEGSVVWSWSGHWNGGQPSGKWSATVQNVSPSAAPAAAIPIPAALTECDVNQCAPGGPGGCAWVFHGNKGEGKCGGGAAEDLVIRQFNADGVVILRTDPPSSSSPGLSAVYTGTLRGNRITGYGTWSWPGHWDNRRPAGQWSATIRDVGSADLPPVPPPLISPEVHPDGSVTFRFLGPQTLEVLLGIDGAKPVMMEKDDQGVWTTTTAPLAPDYYSYYFWTGNAGVIDPSNPALLPNLLHNQSVVHVPGPPSLPWEVTDGPHGVLHHHFYKSAVVGDQRDFYVYTPPGYDPGAKTEYPVLYLLHGYGQLTSSWTETGLANVILDHLIDEGKAKPMIVVIPLANGGEDIIQGGIKAFRNDTLRMNNFDNFIEDLLTEVIPRVESDYRVRKDRNARAITGLSMGGAESLHAGLNHLDEFSWIGAFSSGGMLQNFEDEFPNLDISAQTKLHLLWVACGVDDGWIDLNRDFNKWLDSKGIKHTYIETPGAHTWMVWRRNLANFAPLLFR